MSSSSSSLSSLSSSSTAITPTIAAWIALHIPGRRHQVESLARSGLAILSVKELKVLEGRLRAMPALGRGDDPCANNGTHHKLPSSAKKHQRVGFVERALFRDDAKSIYNEKLLGDMEAELEEAARAPAAASSSSHCAVGNGSVNRNGSNNGSDNGNGNAAAKSPGAGRKRSNHQISTSQQTQTQTQSQRYGQTHGQTHGHGHGQQSALPPSVDAHAFVNAFLADERYRHQYRYHNHNQNQHHSQNHNHNAPHYNHNNPHYDHNYSYNSNHSNHHGPWTAPGLHGGSDSGSDAQRFRSPRYPNPPAATAAAATGAQGNNDDDDDDDNDRDNDAQPRNPTEALLLPQLLQMGFGKQEILDGIRQYKSPSRSSDSQSDAQPALSPTAETIMLHLVSLREEAEEARKEDAVRLESEEHKHEERRRRERRRTDALEGAASPSELAAIFPESWVLEALGGVGNGATSGSASASASTATASTTTGGAERNGGGEARKRDANSAQTKQRDPTKASAKTSASASAEGVFRSVLSRGDSRTEFFEILELEEKSRRWYGWKLPAAYFRRLGSELRGGGGGSDGTVGGGNGGGNGNGNGGGNESGNPPLLAYLRGEKRKLRSGLYGLEEQRNGQPKLFLDERPEEHSGAGEVVVIDDD